MPHASSPRRWLSLFLVAAAFLVLVAPPAVAGPRLTCNATGHLDIADDVDGGWTWTLDGKGVCLDNLQGPYTVILGGTGSSSSLGLCDGVVVRDLNLTVTQIFTKVRGGSVLTQTVTWSLAVTTFPVATPFLVRGGQSGLGVILSRVLLNCPPEGSSTAVYAWNTST